MSVHFRFLAAALLVAALVTGCGNTDMAGTNPHKPGTGQPQDPGNQPPPPPPPPPPPDEDPFSDPPGPRDPRNTQIDTDCDGLTDAEEWGNVYPGDLRTDPGRWDTDGDGLRDGVEAGRTSSVNTNDECKRLFIADADPSSRTNPCIADTDGDGLKDGEEDRSRNGKVDPGETEPGNRDMDGDGLTDGEEDANKSGQVDPGETDPRLRDMDGDGLSDFIELRITQTDPFNPDTDGDSCRDGAEDINGNGVKDLGETNPKLGSDCGAGSLPDEDDDGVPDQIEDANNNKVKDANETDWRNPDTDGDGLRDGLEDRSRNGVVDPGETNPRVKDTDCDGLLDGVDQGAFKGEDTNGNGQREASETDPTKRDTDGDGLLDGVERGIPTGSAPITTCGYVGDADPGTTTGPLNPDSDGDGIADGAEDSNQNGGKDPGELDPRNGADGASNTPAGQACAARNLREVIFKEDSGGDIRLALRPSFQEVKQILLGGKGLGFVGYDDTNKVAFIAYKRGKAGTSTTVVNDELYVRGQFSPSVTSGTVTTQTFTTWDGHPALQAFYDQSATTNLRDYANQVANTLVGSGAGTLTGGATVNGPYKIQAQYVHRSDSSVLVVLAITPKTRFVEPGLFVMGDTAGGTALAQFGDADAVQCETFTTGNGMADFLFVVDDSGSMATSQNALGDAATAVANRLGNSQLDWRISMVTSSYTQTGYGIPSAGVFRGFTRDINQFKAWLQKDAPCPDPSQHCWIDIGGSSNEMTLASGRAAVNHMTNASTPAAQKYRPGARLVVIILTDVRDSGDDSTPVSTYIDYFKSANPTGQLIQMHGIICDPAGGECYPSEPVHDQRHVEVIEATGGIMGSIRSTTSIQNTINTIMDSVIASTGYRTLKPPIGASVRVALESVLDGTRCTAGDLPRSRANGFDVDGISRALAFYGACRPASAGTTKAAISYRYWSDLTSNRDGNPPPCSTDTGYYDPADPDFCKGNLTCNRQMNRCECPSDCGGGGRPGEVCNASREVCDFTCTADCGGTCGGFQACNTSTCTCQCVASATCAPGFKFDPAACGCVCDTAALNCGSTYQADASACACVCKDNCGGNCQSGTQCNMSTCRCEPKLN
ncbi:adventurous gliding motility lipoprotein CglD [Archangium sp.]|uniref:adventurous gliding motility lipoprotein CglD n=1 Tax=Archangium sp. TaxID=1872627 RepID=UPI002D5D9C3F|nr:adventurous gliding motility lipoprotein CglD [Archangium sp.]HYO56290.1 adventurous gliding motility lipoprotein CglD [Archangium sp.]